MREASLANFKADWRASETIFEPSFTGSNGGSPSAVLLIDHLIANWAKRLLMLRLAGHSETIFEPRCSCEHVTRAVGAARRVKRRHSNV